MQGLVNERNDTSPPPLLSSFRYGDRSQVYTDFPRRGPPSLRRPSSIMYRVVLRTQKVWMPSSKESVSMRNVGRMEMTDSSLTSPPASGCRSAIITAYDIAASCELWLISAPELIAPQQCPWLKNSDEISRSE
ncbi:low-molecular-weight cysteine-rich 18 [Striga asiatica]|uniref:Low-molecular-weight cysteine-rich 18 n=1 Tax=Striga asiatica TaxID=4170 RepID=A0A5A7Q0Y5_STRAF|nr:low-molecular-weight cysteine-rich 18 [Striga asiatica]